MEGIKVRQCSFLFFRISKSSFALLRTAISIVVARLSWHQIFRGRMSPGTRDIFFCKIFLFLSNFFFQIFLRILFGLWCETETKLSKTLKNFTLPLTTWQIGLSYKIKENRNFSDRNWLSKKFLYRRMDGFARMSKMSKWRREK
jgi:hypothetical protein